MRIGDVEIVDRHTFKQRVFGKPGKCPDVAQHGDLDQPDDYGGAEEWAWEKLKTHKQERCPTCGFLSLWVKQPKGYKPPLHLRGPT